MRNSFNFHPLEVVSPYRDLQLQVAENYTYLLNLQVIYVWTLILFAMTVIWSADTRINLFKPEFTIVIFIHYQPRVAVAILD